MNQYSASNTATFDWAKAFLVSLAVHALLAMLWVLAILAELFATNARAFVEEVIPEESYVSMPLEIVKAFENLQSPPAPIETKPPTPTKHFVPTRPEQETAEPVSSDRYFGERNTAAASNGEIAEEGLEVPSQDGRKTRTATDMELTNSDFADGDTAGAPGQPGEPLPLSQPTAEATPNPIEEIAETQPEDNTEPVEETPLLEPLEPTELISEETSEIEKAEVVNLLETEENIPVPKKEETPEPQEEAEEIAAVEESIPEPKPQTQPQEASSANSGNRGLDGGFDREASRTRLSGTIRRRGESSLEVEDSIKGRFFAQVNKEIEKAWQRECLLRRQHILPGVLSVSFSVNETGKVTGFRFDSRIAGGAIQEGFTMRAIQKAKIPSMPAEIKGELDGSQLEMNLTFFF